MSWSTEDLVDDNVPLWVQLANRFRAGIDAEEFLEGDVLPSESQIVARFRVSRSTARNALNQLEHEGLVLRRSGKGTTVLPPKVEQPLNLLRSFSEDMRHRGLEPGYGRLRVYCDEMPTAAAGALGGAAGEPTLRVERLLLANGSAIALSTSWLAPAAVPARTPVDNHPLLEKSLYGWLEAVHEIRIAGGTEVIEAAVTDKPLAAALDVAVGSPLLVATRTARAVDGAPIEYVERQYRADRYRYRIELVRP
ncbi:GntR family transcriptional regulator [Mycobacterium sp. NPDC003449]